MARKKSETSAARKKTPEDRAEKKFREALAALEKIAHERCLTAHDPFSVTLKMAKEIRKLSEQIEGEAECSTSTEACECGIGVGIGA